ncbi:unnamed protein product [Symbiodinium microadriaticum]|nr:unnamed protein product [Symbiodinium microadriaticum]CAE7906778.1 unnamed protein product [Symbiodinium sp. KB8]
MLGVPEEGLPALVAGVVGVAAAMVFVLSGASSQPTSWDKEAREEETEPSMQAMEGTGQDKSGVEGPKAAEERPLDLRLRQGKLKPEEEAKFRQGVANLSPESKMAIKEWMQLTGEGDTWALLGLNCMLLIFIAGLLALAAAAIVGGLQVNIFDMDVWRDGYNKLQIAMEKGSWPRQLPVQSQTLHHDMAEL